MKFKHIFLLSVVAFIITSCASSYSVKSDFERGIDFSSYKTFKILKQESEFPWDVAYCISIWFIQRMEKWLGMGNNRRLVFVSYFDDLFSTNGLIYGRYD